MMKPTGSKTALPTFSLQNKPENHMEKWMVSLSVTSKNVLLLGLLPEKRD